MDLNLFVRTRRFYRENGAAALPRKIAAYLDGRMIQPFRTDHISKRRLDLGRALFKKSGGKVLMGPLRGFHLSPAPVWGAGDFGPMLLGTYESPILAKLIELSRDADVLIDIGAADGFFGVGMVANGYFKKSACFEINAKMRLALKEVAILNGVEEHVVIFGVADDRLTTRLEESAISVAKAVVLCDIEGGEFDVITPELLNELRRCPFIIELHEANVKDGPKRLAHFIQHAEVHFDISFIDRGAREIPEHEYVRDLSENDRWLLVSEGRAINQRWLILTPRKDS